MKYRFVSAIIAAGIALSLYACSFNRNNATPDSPAAPTQTTTPATPTQTTTPEPTHAATPEPSQPHASASERPEEGEDFVHKELSGEVRISFHYVRQSGSASNQHAVWVEDMDGKVIRTIYASRWTADGGYRSRPDSIAEWVRRAGLENMVDSEVDAISGATPTTGPLTYIWDLKDAGGNTVPSGDYVIFVEGTLRWKNFVIYSAVITLGNDPDTVSAVAEFHFEGGGRYEELTAGSLETSMIGPVTVEFIAAP